MKSIYVVAHDGGMEGQSLPFLAFESKEDVFQWVKTQTDIWSITEVSIFPELPKYRWFDIQSEN